MLQARVLYPLERGPMGGAPYIGPRLGDGPTFEVSVSRLYVKECPGNLSTLACGCDTSLYVLECSLIKSAWLPSLAVYTCLVLLKHAKS